MDLSKEYIEMSQKAEEIQVLSPVVISGKGRIKDVDNKHYGSFFFLPVSNRVEILHSDNDEARDMVGGYGDDLIGIVWLPRQDQLQEILFKNNVWQFVHRDFWDWIDEPKEGQVFHSLEQLWLAFVMFKKYQKYWNCQEWVKEQTVIRLKCLYGLDGILTEGKIYGTSGKARCGQYPVICDNGEILCVQEKHFWNEEKNRLEEV